MFAKLFERDNKQIVVMLDYNDEDEPEVRFYFKPEGLGVCHVGLGFENCDDGQERAEQYLEKVTEEEAFKVVDKIMKQYHVPKEWAV